MNSNLKENGTIKGYIKNTRNNSIMQFLYNPTSFADSHDINYSDMTGVRSSYPSYQFLCGTGKTTKLELFLYDWSGKKIIEQIAFLNSFIPKAEQGIVGVCPPPMIFSFGWYVKKCIMTNLSVEYLQFDENLNPQHAIATLSLTYLGVKQK